MFAPSNVNPVCRSQEFISKDCFAKAVLADIMIADEYKDSERLAKRTNDKTLQEYRDLVRAIETERDPVKLGKLKRTLNEHYPDHTIIIRDADTHEDKAYRVPNPYRALSYREDAVTTFAEPGADSRYDPDGKMRMTNMNILDRLVPQEMIADKAMAIALLESFWFCGQNPDVGSDPRCFPARILGELREYQAGRIQQAQEVEAREVLEKSSWPAVQRILWSMLVATSGAKVFPFNEALMPKPMPVAAAGHMPVAAAGHTSTAAAGHTSTAAAGHAPAAAAAGPVGVEEDWFLATTVVAAAPIAAAGRPPAAIPLLPAAAKENDIVGIYLIWNGKLMIHRRGPGLAAANTISTPGGSVDDGETFDQAARRELREESGFALPPTDVLVPFYVTVTPTGKNLVLFRTELTAKPVIPGPLAAFRHEVDMNYGFTGIPGMETAGPGSGHAWVDVSQLGTWLDGLGQAVKHHNFRRALTTLQRALAPPPPPAAALPLGGTGGAPLAAALPAALPLGGTGGAPLAAALPAALAKGGPLPAAGAVRGLTFGPMTVPIIRQLGTVGAGVPRVLPFALGTLPIRA